MNSYYKEKTKVLLNHKFVGYADAVSVDRNNGQMSVNVQVWNDTKNEKGGVISYEENYNQFFKKFSKAFSKE